MTPRALITGANGFVGKVLAAHLCAQGWEVRCSDIAVPPGDDAWRTCDVSRRDTVEQLLEWGGPLTHVFHLAAVTFVPEAGRDPARTFEINLLGTVHLARALLERLPHARLVYIGSAEVYGVPEHLPITEGHPLAPANPYAISKAAADQYCAWLHQSAGLDVVRMRPFNHSGPGQSDRFVLSSFAHQIARIESRGGFSKRSQPPPEAGQPLALRVGNLQSRRDFSHVDDVVRAYEQAALNGVAGDAYNVCSGRPVAIQEALDRLLAMSTAPIQVDPDPERLRTADVTEAWGSCEKLRAHTGWQHEKGLDDVLADLLAYWRDQEAGSVV